MSQQAFVVQKDLQFVDAGFLAKQGDVFVFTPPQTVVVYRNGDIQIRMAMNQVAIDGLLINGSMRRDGARKVVEPKPEAPKVEEPLAPVVVTETAPVVTEEAAAAPEASEVAPETPEPGAETDEPAGETEEAAGETTEEAPAEGEAPAPKKTRKSAKK